MYGFSHSEKILLAEGAGWGWGGAGGRLLLVIRNVSLLLSLVEHKHSNEK